MAVVGTDTKTYAPTVAGAPRFRPMGMRERLGLWCLRPSVTERMSKAKIEVGKRGVASGPEYEAGYWMGRYSAYFFFFR